MDTVKELIVNYSRETPLVVMLDNAQWLDSSSAEMLHHLVDVENSTFFAVLLSQSDRLPAPLVDAPPGVSVRLGELNNQECKAFLGEQPNVEERLINEMIVRAKGNPLFLRELASNISPDGELKLPDSIYDVITASFDKLDNEDKTLVRKASVIGQTFDIATLDVLERIST